MVDTGEIWRNAGYKAGDKDGYMRGLYDALDAVREADNYGQDLSPAINQILRLIDAAEAPRGGGKERT